eukprot:318939-Chlamydomonas_euryale.AAC.1
MFSDDLAPKARNLQGRKDRQAWVVKGWGVGGISAGKWCTVSSNREGISARCGRITTSARCGRIITSAQ